MKYLASAASVLLLINAALAIPMSQLKEDAKDRIRARGAARRTQRLIATSDLFVNDTAATVTSTNWGGAALTGSGFTSVTGTFTVPKPSVPSGGSSSTEYCGAAWVGIDGYSDSDLIQTGVLWCIQNGAYEYEAWYEYLPASLIGYSGISVTAGSVVTVTAVKTGTNSGTTTLSSGGVSVSHTFSGQSSPLPGTSAEWITEDFTSGNSLVPFANFGTVTWTGATAIQNGATVTAANSNNIILESSSGAALTSTTISGSTVVTKYV